MNKQLISNYMNCKK